MNIQVQSLKVLATRVVMMKNIDYSTYLTGVTKEELDRLDKLEGKYRIQSSKVTIEAHYNGKRLPSDDWEYFRECLGKHMPDDLIKMIESEPEFSIIQESRNGLRNWVVLDGLYWRKEFLGKRNDLRQNQWGQWRYTDDFIEDGRLVSVAKLYQVTTNGKVEDLVIRRFSTTIGKEGNVMWEFMWGAPKFNIKITKVMWALRL